MKFKKPNLEERIAKIRIRRFEEKVESLRGYNAKPLEEIFPDLTSTTVKEILKELIKKPFSHNPYLNPHHNEPIFRLDLLEKLSKLGFEEEIKLEAKNLADYYKNLSFNFKGKPPHNGSRDNDIKRSIDCLILAHAPKKELISFGDKLFNEHEYEWENAIRYYETAGSLEGIVNVGKSYLKKDNLDNSYKAFKKGQADNNTWGLFKEKADEFISLVEQGGLGFGYGKGASTLKKYYLERKNKEKVKKIIILDNPSISRYRELFETLNPSRKEYEQLAEGCLKDIVNPEVAIGLYEKAETKPNKEKFTEIMKKHIDNGSVLSGVTKYLVTFPDINVDLFEDLYKGIIMAPHCWVRDIREINKNLELVCREIPQSIISQHASWLLRECPYYPSSAIELYEEFNLKPDIDGIKKSIEYCLKVSEEEGGKGYENRDENRALKAYKYLEKLI